MKSIMEQRFTWHSRNCSGVNGSTHYGSPQITGYSGFLPATRTYNVLSYEKDAQILQSAGSEALSHHRSLPSVTPLNRMYRRKVERRGTRSDGCQQTADSHLHPLSIKQCKLVSVKTLLNGRFSELMGSILARQRDCHASNRLLSM